MYKAAGLRFGNGNTVEGWTVLRKGRYDTGRAKPLVSSYQVIWVPSGRKYTGRVFAWVNVSTRFS